MVKRACSLRVTVGCGYFIINGRLIITRNSHMKIIFSFDVAIFKINSLSTVIVKSRRSVRLWITNTTGTSTRVTREEHELRQILAKLTVSSATNPYITGVNKNFENFNDVRATSSRRTRTLMESVSRACTTVLFLTILSTLPSRVFVVVCFFF